MKHVKSLIIVFVLSLAVTPVAMAQSRSLEEGPIVRRQLLFRSARLELTPMLQHSLNDTYQRTLFLGLGVNYHLTNAFSIGLTAGWGALSYDTGLADNIAASNPAVNRRLNFAENTLLTNIHIGFVPFYGKFNFLRASTINWDFHLIVGAAGALVSADSPDIEGFKFGPAFGAGFRFYVNGDTALSLDVTDHMYSVADIQRDGTRADEQFSHTVLFSLGVSFFVTGDLRVSR
ncbi:MAG: outer membrane beta-barrel domain-containing protein [Myxococcales bacterium]|nr:outer membrane beta-barrel domain-containing protein [Myxococcales bacterium]